MEYLIGVVLGLAIAVLGKLLGFSKDNSFYPVILIVIATYYVLFAVIAASTDTIIKELVAALLFSVLALIGARISAFIVAAGLVAHGLFDVLHDQFLINAGVPAWWPGFCSAIDIVLGLVVLYLARSRLDESFKPAPKTDAN